MKFTQINGGDSSTDVHCDLSALNIFPVGVLERLENRRHGPIVEVPLPRVHPAHPPAHGGEGNTDFFSFLQIINQTHKGGRWLKLP